MIPPEKLTQINKLGQKRMCLKELGIPAFVLMILHRLHVTGHEAYVVGGAVRDMCMHRPVADWDVATSASPLKIRSIFNDIRNFSLKHETMTLVDEDKHYEVTTFRGGRGKAKTIGQDLAHRDFTINAMAYDLGKMEVVDPCGGIRDLSRKIVRATGEAEERFAEDPLRLLRAIRLATELRFCIEPATLNAIRTMTGQLKSTAQERIREELIKILVSRKPSYGFNLMRRTGLLKDVLPELLEGYGKRQNPEYHRFTIYRHTMETVDRSEVDPILRLTALLHDIAKPRVREKIAGKFRFYGHEEASALLAREIMERLKFSNETMGLVTNLIENHMRVVGYHVGWSDGAVRRLIRRVGEENMARFLSFRRADLLAHGVVDEKLELFSELEKRVKKVLRIPLVAKAQDLAIDGHKVMEVLGLTPGPEVGEVLHMLMERVTDHPELNTEERLISVLGKMDR
jgi:tRNA nucleotidyltransferase (CCA-adding enzyme)